MRVFKCMRMHNNSPAKSAVCPLNKPSKLCKIPEMRYNSATSNCEVSKQCAGTFKNTHTNKIASYLLETYIKAIRTEKS